MRYAKQGPKQKLMRRSIEIARVRTGGDLALMRDLFIELCDEMALAAYPPCVTGTYDPIEMDRRLLPIQARSRLNSMIAQEARMRVREAVPEQMKRRQRRLFGKLLNLASRPAKPGPKSPKFLNLPDDLTERVGEDEVLRVAETWSGLGWAQVMARVGVEAADDTPDADAPADLLILRHCIRAVNERYGAPSWSGEGKDRKKVRINLYPQTLRASGTTLAAAKALLSEQARSPHPAAISFPLHLTSALPRGEPVKILATLAPRRVLRLRGEADEEALRGSAIFLDIGPKDAVVRVVFGKPEPAPEESFDTVIARDHGSRNTVGLCVLRLPNASTAAQVSARISAVKDKDSAREWLSENVAPDGVEVIERVLISADGFRRHLRDLSRKVDGLNGTIDQAYKRLRDMKECLAQALGLGDEDQVPETPPEGAAQELLCEHAAFFKLLARISSWKDKRRGIYDRVAGVKRSWFGHVSSRELALARKHGAVLIREDLTYVTAERGAPDYKGPAFNRMVNETSRGQYQRTASAKLAWAGVREFAVPSFYTSCTDHRHGIVDARQRRSRLFVASANGERSDSDLHAAETIGLWAFLVPKRPVRNSLALNSGPPLPAAAT